jgi:hypothetical protein
VGWSLVAFLSLDALSISVAHIWVLAHAGWSARTLGAFLGHLRITVDEERWWHVAGGHAVHLAAAFLNVHFAIGRALGFWLGSASCGFRLAVGSGHAFALGILEVSFFTEATDLALPDAYGAGMWVVAGGRAWRTAG